ncbi:HNH endonuclease [Pseudomonas rubra]|uniref:HNH endonuclease n=1 Tax=Pseudomonas rubra TaxID=2942627 RepID=A0ABT5PBB3_9PSED|nr:HNH endonuclease [Pseudomonas rubra]MDD1015605.1 HNH endonuclease [Pseudomonas rubra]MDD1040956.1 HNH endonuclease [Pseudomonas rubra]MDD1154805.1 HNH endonuclease [Pseudomonas rubra]
MRPVKKSSNNQSYAPDAAQSFSGAVAALLQKIDGVATQPNYTIDLDRVLKLLLERAKGLPIAGVTAVEQDVLVTGLKQRVTTLYKTAALPLTQELGAFCAYCGTALPGLVEVEHTVPKAPYPMYATTWENFLPACGPCNTSKGNKPDRITATQSSGIHAPDETDLRNTIRYHCYIWPDLAPDCYRRLPLKLHYHDSNRWIELDPATSVNGNNQLTAYDVIQHQILATIEVNHTLLNDVPVTVVVDCAAHDTVEADTIDLTGLNDDSSSIYDRRQMNRTRAWFDALEECRLLGTAQSGYDLDLLWKGTPRRAASSGFYAVWLTVMQAYGAHYATRFVQETKNSLYYPQTNTHSLP